MRSHLVLAAAAALAAASCGGGSSPVAPAAAVPAPQHGKTASAQLSIVIPLPRQSTSTRRPRFVSSGTQSGGLAVNGAAVSQAFSLAANAPGCTATGTTRTCQVTVDLPLGADVVALSTYDGPLVNGRPTGHLLATATVTQTIIESRANVVALSLLGIPASATIVPQQATIVSTGSPVSVPLAVTVYDAAGNAITGTDAYAQPVDVMMQSAAPFQGRFTFSVNGGPAGGGRLTSPQDTIALLYGGRGGSGSYTLAATTNFGNQQLGGVPFDVQPGFRLTQQIFTGGMANADLVQRYDNRDIWFTEPTAHKLGAYAANGSFTEYPVTSGKEPRHIVFTGIFASGVFPGSGQPFIVSELPDTIGLVQTNGSIVEHTIPTANAGLAGILFDSVHGTLWFAEQTAGKIGAYQVGGGGFSEYPIGIAGSAPTSLAQNSLNGGLWFTDRGTNAIGLLKPDHTVVEYPIPTANAKPSVIVGQTSSDTWFAEDNAPVLGHIDNATGAIVEYPAGDVLVSLVPGASDGFTTLWALTRGGTVEHFDASGHYVVVPSTLGAGGLPVVLTIGSNDDLFLLRNGVSVSDLDELIY